LRQGPAGLHDEPAAALVENSIVGIPRAENGNFSAKFLELIQPFEHGGIRIRPEFVAVDRVVGIAGGHFIVARVGKRLAVGDVRHAALQLVAENLSLLGHGAPQEWKQQRTAGLGVRAPVALAQFLRPQPASTRL
jgi:hypothetical protein